MRQAEKSSAQDILNEGLRRFPSAEAIQRQGRPEREIVNAAAEWHIGTLAAVRLALSLSDRPVGLLLEDL